ncbi:hypothetical protein ACQKFS_02585 [Pseudomonas guineae]|uniref:hypothetical protein n=1 Tax=Pseudomonas guineae TaxID=425504 RepID=UPI003CFBD7E8
MATHYSKNDPGLPFTLVTGGGLTGFQNLKKILLACLVTGYGAKVAAGWSLEAEGPAYVVLANGPKSGYLCFTFQGAVQVYLAKTFTGMAGNFMTGEGLKSGTAANNLAPQCLGFYWVFSNLPSNTWTVVADAKSFVFAANGFHSGNTLIDNANSYSAATFFCGEDSVGNFLSVGGNNMTGPSETGALDQFDQRGMTCLNNPNTGLLVGASGSLSVAVPSMFGYTPARFTFCTIPEEVELARVYWGIPGGLSAGYLRGVANPGMGAVGCGAIHTAYGRPGLLTGDAHLPFDLGDTYTYIVPAMSQNAGSSLRVLTDNPRFW